VGVGVDLDGDVDLDWDEAVFRNIAPSAAVSVPRPGPRPRGPAGRGACRSRRL